MRKRLALAAVAAIAAVIAAFVGASKAPSAAAVSCGTEATVGYFGPTTGPVASIGAELRGFSVLYAQQWNAKGKKPTMKVVEGDTQFDPKETSTVATQFASNQNMLGVIGPGASQEVLAAGTIYKRAGMPYVAASATRTSLTNGSLPTFLRIAAPDSIQAKSTAEFIVGKLKSKSVLAVDDQSAYGKPLADEVGRQLRAKGVKVKRASVTQKQSDYTSVISSMPDDADLVYMAIQVPEKMTLFGVQLKEQGKGSIKVMLADAGGSGVKLNGAYFSTFGPDVTKYGPAQAVLKAYHAKYGAKAPVTAFGPLAYESGRVVVDAVARACKNGSATRAEVLRELHKTNIAKSIFGDPIRFNARGDRIGAHFFTFQITAKGPVPVPFP
jgi:branched-chain amino acid transport system substrate-binding protein